MTKIQNAAYWIEHLNLTRHPEGGYYKEVYGSDNKISRQFSSQLKDACTSIYYLLEEGDYSVFHKLLSDELWYFHKGEPLNIHVINKDGKYTVFELSDTISGSLSVVIEAGQWFAAEVLSKKDFTLVSCAVAPGFEFAEFEIARKDQLILLYPQHSVLINKFCNQ
jgi:predicted cupin superfamily sugar epimerase